MPRLSFRKDPASSALRQTLTTKSLIFLSVFCCCYILWSQFAIVNYTDLEEVNEELAEEAINNVAQDLRYSQVYRKKEHLPKELKYILLWTAADFEIFPSFGTGQKAFITNNCSVIDCYVTTDRNFFGGDVTKFHAIAFNGRNTGGLKKKDLPQNRSPHQKYIYVMSESPQEYPICESFYDDYFNLTYTYKLDSDIIDPYLVIKDAEGKVIGPRIDMTWDHLDEDGEEDATEEISLRNKTKAAAWFVSHCKTISRRENFVEKLDKALEQFNLNVDTYGYCGNLKCPRFSEECNDMLERDYFFYMSLENSIAQDYVTEKLLTALQHGVVPIVWGGADYSRFLPPNSYIDGRSIEPEQLAFKMYDIMESPKLYQSYFKWKKHYSYAGTTTNLCALCELLNDKTQFETRSSYKHLRRWWNETPNPEKCKKWLKMLFF